MTTTLYGYLTTPYLNGPYLGGYVGEGLSSQVNQKIYNQKKLRSQIDQKIDSSNTLSEQIEQKIYDQMAINSQVSQTIYYQRRLRSQIDQKINISSIISEQIEQKIYDQMMISSQTDQKLYYIPKLSSQVNMRINTELDLGSQVEQKIYDAKSLLSQIDLALKNIESTVQSQVSQKVYGLELCNEEVRIYPLQHLTHETYLTTPYLTGSYLAGGFYALQRSQVEQKIYDFSAINSQIDMILTDITSVVKEQVLQKIYGQPHVKSQIYQKIYDFANIRSQIVMAITEVESLPSQIQQKIYKLNRIKEQVYQTIYNPYEQRSQVKMRIDDVKLLKEQVKQKIYHQNAVHSQVIKIQKKTTFEQVTMVIYNVTQLRILQNFVSRGIPNQLGLNWTSNVALKTGDYGTANINTDVLEQRCQTAAIVPEWILTCDTGITQGAFVDTLCILEHNLTTSARVIFQGSNDLNFNTVGIEVTLVTELLNTYWIAPTLPTSGFRYYRLIIRDQTNPASGLYVGTILFGSSAILSVTEPIENPISLGYTHYKNSVDTEGYRTVSNDRAIRKQLSLSFTNMRYEGGNYNLLKNYWLTNKTDLACVVIPRPTKPSAFAVFAKLVNLPREEHNAISDRDHYVSFSLDWDESL